MGMAKEGMFTVRDRPSSWNRWFRLVAKEGGVLHQQQQPQVEHHPKGNNPRELPLEPAADGLPLLWGRR